MDSRRASVQLWYNNANITSDVSPILTAFEYTDGLEAADDIQITVKDDGVWHGANAPAYGASLQASILLEAPGGAKTTLNCGSFVVDDPEYTYPPWSMTLKGGSIYATNTTVQPGSATVSTATGATTGTLRVEKKHRGVENVTLEGLAGQIAARSGLRLNYLPSINPSFTRSDQSHVSDLVYLTKMASNYGLRVKCSNGALTLFSQAAYDALPAVATFGPGDVTAAHFVYGSVPVYKECVVRWRDPKGGAVYEGIYIPPDALTTGQVLRLNVRCESSADAIQIAQYRLQKANRGQKESTLTVPGNTLLVAGSNINTLGFGGVLDCKWSIEEARHSLWPYSTEMTLRRIQ